VRRRAAVLVVLLGLSAPAALADDPAEAAANEVVVFGGAAILDASRSVERTIELPSLPGRPGLPDIRFGARNEIGTSALFGARYSRRIKERLAVEVDLAVAPDHGLETKGSLCVGGRCFGDGRGGLDGIVLPASLPREALRDGDVTAWHYGAGLAYELASGDLRPLLVAGAGGVTWSGAGDSETDLVFRFGAGLKILFGRVGARIDVVDHLVLDHFLSEESEHDVHASAGLLVRF
jgi:hypothetical protein